MLAGWGTLVVEIGYAFFIWPRRTRKVWCIATIGLHLGMALFMGLVFFSSVMILLTGCLFLIPEKIPEDIQEQPAAPGRRQPLLARAPRGHLPSASSRERHRGASGLSDDFAPLVRRLMARDQIPGVAVGVVERGHLVFARGFGYRDVDQAPAGHARHALCSRVLLEGVHGDGDRSACGRGKNRARRSRPHVPSRFFPRRSGGVGDLDDAGSAHPPQRITPA